MGAGDADRAAWRYAADLARARTEGEAAAVLARAAAEAADASHGLVWIFDRVEGYRLAAAWPQTAASSPGARVARAVTLGTPIAGAGPKPHRSHLVLPLVAGDRPIGALELRESARAEGPFSEAEAARLDGLVSAADSALEAARGNSARERDHLETVLRLSLLYDLSRSIAAARDTGRLLDAIANRTQNALEASQAVVWLPEEDGARFRAVAAVGDGAGEIKGQEVEADGSLVGEAAATGDVVTLDERPELADERGPAAAVATPIVEEDTGTVLGVLEALFADEPGVPPRALAALLREVASISATAIVHERRRSAEERASDLGTLLDVAQELSASLDPDRVAFALAHKGAGVIRYKRATVGLVRGGRVEVAAVSGSAFVDPSLPEVRAAGELARWACDLDEGLYVVREDDGTIDAERPETREKFRVFFEATGSRSALAVPLRDDDGRLGVFVIESDEAFGFSAREIEAASLLGVQATVALRNATLYRQIPMARVFAPLGRGTSRIKNWSGSRRIGTFGGILAALILLALPVPLRVGGDARVLPAHRVVTSAEVEGRVARVYVREGDAVKAGQPIAELDDVEYRNAYDAARARFESALREESRRRARGETAAAAVEAARTAGLRAEVQLAEERLGRTVLRAASAGIVTTPRVDEQVGVRLARGEAFCEIADASQPTVDISVPESDAGFLREGQSVKAKLVAFPARSFHGVVERVGVTAFDVEGTRSVLLRASLDPEGCELAQGMTGRSKITVGRAPVARIILRRPVRWIWAAVWGWLP